MTCSAQRDRLVKRFECIEQFTDSFVLRLCAEILAQGAHIAERTHLLHAAYQVEHAEQIGYIGDLLVVKISIGCTDRLIVIIGQYAAEKQQIHHRVAPPAGRF